VNAKACTRCGEEKPLEEFRRRAASADGLRPDCKPCHTEQSRAWRAANPERARATVRAWRQRNPERNKANRRALYRKHDLKKDFGLTIEEYDAMLAAQLGVCAICGREETATYRGRIRQLAVDHDHETGKIRGLLCGQCNRGLGCFTDDSARLIAAATYLDERR
jgi:hypothetical protein